MRVEFDLEDLAAVQDLFTELRENADRAENPLRAFTEDFMRLSEAVWRTRGGIIGAPWRALAPAYLAEKQRQGRGSLVLELTGGTDGGRLRRSLTQRGARWQRLDIKADEAVVATQLGIAGIHQKGGTLKTPKRSRSTTIPARPFVKPRPQDVEWWTGLVQDHLIPGSGLQATFRGIG